MSNYFNNLNNMVKEYFSILSHETPDFLDKYIETKEMKHLSGVSLSCGMDYTKFYNIPIFYSQLEHSVGVALIIWNFTKDKKQTLAGLFHDIASPTFKHCIDFMNNDHVKQESTEKNTYNIIKNSKEIMKLLKEDNIKIEEVSDYKIYPIADNNSPKLSADRLEYNFSSGLTFKKIWNLDDIRKIYNNLVITKNEDNINELAFTSKDICKYYINNTLILWKEWISDKNRISMQFIADTCKSLINKKLVTIDDLYKLSEQDIIDKIYKSKDNKLIKDWTNFINTNKVYKSNTYIKDKYCIKVSSKKRYIDPLVINNNKILRISSLSKEINNNLVKYLSINFEYYIYINI